MKNTHKDNKYYTAKYNMVTIVGVTLRKLSEIYISQWEEKKIYALVLGGL